MIPANELRIGSKVNRRFWNPDPKNPAYELEICEVFSIQQLSVHIVLKDGKIIGRYLCEQLEPVFLTFEILEKCSFEYIDRRLCIINGWCFDRSFGGTGLIFKYDHYCDPKNRQVTIKYLHQFQNLYHALTGEELNMQL